MKTRLVFLSILLVMGIVIGVVLFVEQTRSPLPPTMTSAFQIFGETVRVADRLAGRLMPVSDLDEAELGQALKSFYVQEPTETSVYVNELLSAVAARAQKDFGYEAHVLPSPYPNAMALPGGIIFVTEGLLETLESESQLGALLAHEVGHVELSHCVDRVKYEITARKLGVITLGAMADMTVRLMLGHAFSKTQEHETDMYAWTWLRHSRYDPRGIGESFGALRNFSAEQDYDPGLLRDYFTSHPPLEVRAQEFMERADRWWRQNRAEKRYVGKVNLESLQPLGDGPGLPEEWISGLD
jgi:predicted Zn-dependent protease